MCTLSPTDISILGNNKLSTKQFPVVTDRQAAAELLLGAHPEIQHCTFSPLLKSFTVLSLQMGRNTAVTGEDPSDQRTSEDNGGKGGGGTGGRKKNITTKQNKKTQQALADLIVYACGKHCLVRFHAQLQEQAEF